MERRGFLHCSLLRKPLAVIYVNNNIAAVMPSPLNRTLFESSAEHSLFFNAHDGTTQMCSFSFRTARVVNMMDHAAIRFRPYSPYFITLALRACWLKLSDAQKRDRKSFRAATSDRLIMKQHYERSIPGILEEEAKVFLVEAMKNEEKPFLQLLKTAGLLPAL